MAAHEGQYFVNYSTTRAFALMDVTADESPFPTSPLKHTIPRLLRKGFIVELVSTGTGPEGVDHLRIVPRKNNPGAFTADLWLKAGGDVVRGFELHCENCAHPFRLLFDRGRLDTVDLRYRQTWSSTPVPHPEVMQLEYRMVYSGPTGTDAFATNAVMHAFDPTHSFNLPYFKYPSGVADYRKIGWLPEDTTFWQHMPAPLPTARLKRDMEFLRMHDLNRSDWREQLDDPTNFFKPPYAVWSPDRRIHINDLAGTYPSSAGHRVASGAVLPDLVAQFYLDVDTIDGILRHRSYTVADGYQTLVPSNRLPWSDCFYNIWFDLCEIRRRRLEAELDKPGTDLIRAHVLYMKHSAALRRMTRRFLEETGHGTRCEPLYRWNARVKKALGVDNIALLGM